MPISWTCRPLSKSTLSSISAFSNPQPVQNLSPDITSYHHLPLSSKNSKCGKWRKSSTRDTTETRSSIESSGLVSTTQIIPGILPGTSKTRPTSSGNSTRNTLRNHPLQTKNMSTTATVDANKCWTFTNTEQANTETEHDYDWGIPANATTTDRWNAPPPPPSPPLSAVEQPRTNDHVSLHWTACYDDHCSTHRQMKDYNYYPQRSSGRCHHRRNRQMCDCLMPHPHELVKVTWE